MKPQSWNILTLTSVGVLCAVSSSKAQTTYTRQNNATLLNAAGAWSAGGPPTSADIALWNATAAGNLGVALGGSVNWGQIQIVNPSGGVTIANTASAVHTLSGVAGVGIDMSAATQNLTINNTVALGGSQSWNVASGRTLTIGGYNINTTGTTLAKTGAGTLAVNSSTFTSSSGNLAINGGRVLYAGGNSLPSGNLSMNGGHLEDYFQGTAFSRTLGTGAGAVQITGGTSGFSESGSSGYWSVSLGTSIQWNNGAGTFNPSEFLLMGSAAQAQTNSGGGTLRIGGITFSSNIDLNGADRTIRVNQQDGGASGSADGAVAGNGAIITGSLTDSLGSGGALTKNGVGRLILNPGTGNTYTGGTTISQGTLRFMKLTAMPASGAVSVQAGGILGVSVAAGSDWTTATGNANGTIGGLIAGNGGQAGSTVSWAAGNVGLDLNVASAQSYSGDIANPSGATLALHKTGTGTLTLSGNSSYTGQTVILGGNQGTAGGVLAVGTLANAGNNSPIGAFATAGAGGLSLRNGTFRYTGGTTTTDRGFSLDYNGQSSTIDISGTSGTVLTMGDFAINAYNQVRFNITGTAGNSLVLGNGTLNKQLYLTTNIPLTTGTLSLVGAQTIDNNGSAALTIGGVTGSNTNLTFNTTSSTTVTGQITTGSGTLTKSAASVVTLSGNNTYTGQTSATAGVLRLDHATALPGGIAASGGTSNLRINGGVVGLTANSGNFARAVGTGAAQVQWVGNGGFAAYGGTRNVLLSASSINWVATSFIGNGNTLILGHATADATLNWQQQISTAGGTRTVQVDNGSASIDAIMSGEIAGGTSGNTNGFTKTGTGTLALTGSNTYWGPTTISTGTLMIGDGTGTTGNLSSNGTGISIATNAVLAVNRTAIVSQGTNSAFGDAVPITGGGSILIIGGNSGTGGAGLNQANTFTGGVTLQSGTLRIGSNGVAGTSGPLGNGGTLTINGGTIDTSSATARVVANVNPIVANGDFAFTGTGDLTLPGTVDLGGTTRTITTNGSMLTLSGVISNGTLTKAGVGMMALAGNNSFSGGLTNSDTGTLILQHSNAAGSGTLTLASTLNAPSNNCQLSGGINVANPVTIDASTGRNNIASASGDNILSGNITVKDNGYAIIMTNGTTNSLTIGGVTPNSTTISGTGTTFTNTLSFRAAGGINGGVLNSQINLPSATVDFNNSANWTFNSTGNTWANTSLFNGTVKLGATDALATGAVVNASSASPNSGTVDLNGFNQTVAGLGGTGTGTNVITNNSATNDSTLTLSGLTTNRSSVMVIADGATKKVSLVMNSSGRTQTLSSSNTYTGTTSISNGTLTLTGATQATSTITVAAGGSLGLDTAGTVTASSATVSLGGTVTVTGTPILPNEYILLTASSITGTPVLANTIPGYSLVIQTGNTLKLVPSGGSGFASWQSANSTAGGLNADHDGDGVSNGIEFFIYGPNANSSFTALPGVVNNGGLLQVTWSKHTGYTGSYTTDYVVETSDSLTGTWTAAATNVAPNVPGTVYIDTVNNTVIYTFPSPLGTKKFARLNVTGPN